MCRWLARARGRVSPGPVFERDGARPGGGWGLGTHGAEGQGRGDRAAVALNRAASETVSVHYATADEGIEPPLP